MSLRPPVSEMDHIQGNNEAAIELVEYGDYQCPHCGRAYPIVKKLQEEFGDQLRFVFRNFPLAKIHPEAIMAAVATEAAALQDKYWEMHDIIFENQDQLDKNSLLDFGRELGLDINQFEIDMDDPALKEKVEADFESGIRSGVNATPTFFINGSKYNNGWEGDRMLEYIKANKVGLLY
ncbi:MAG: thioredoxin domain-containing protein [Bacteroidota bacterium]